MAASGVMKDCPNLQQLQNAIKFGDIENAKQLVSQLAEQKALLNIEPKKSETSESATRDIRVKVYLEDKDSSGASLNWTVNPYTTIKELKERLEEEQSIPQEVQKWIIGKRIRKDTETLSYCNVRTSGCSLYVYLLSASKVGLTRQDYENRIDVLSSRDVPQERAVNRLTEQVGELRLEYDFQQPARIQPQAPPPIPEEDVLPSISQVGWCCEQCTFHNEPTRPGCEMCGGDRPQDYVIPQGLKYKMSEKEKQRLEDEQEAERLAREINDANFNSLAVNFDSMPAAEGGAQDDFAVLYDYPSIVRHELIKEAQNMAENENAPGHLDHSVVVRKETMDRLYDSSIESDDDYYNKN